MTDRLAELGALRYAAENTATHATSPNRLAAAGYIHAAFAEYQTWAAANPGINPSRLSAKGRLFGYFYDNATFSPLSLFAASEQGAWYDPSDLSTLFQDSAGTIPVTADGQPVGKILDKSGRGNHASQATAASRPLYKTDGTYHWLQFDGVDDSLATVSFDLSLSTTASLFCGFDKTVDTNPGWMFENTTGNAAGISVAQRGTGIEIGFKTSTETNETVSPYPAQQKIVVSALLDPSNPVYQEKIGIRVNETPVEGSVWNTASGGNFGDFPLNIGKRSDGYYLAFHLNSLILRGALSTTQEITETETWVAAKTGVFF